MPIIVGNTTTNSAITSTSLSEMTPQSFVVTNALRNSVRPALLLPFAQSGTVDPRITFTRSSSATYFNSQGVLTTAPNNVPRIDFDPATGRCLGLLIEVGRTNSIRNNTTQGATTGVIGSGGSLGTYWTQSQNSGIIPNVVAVGIDSGIPYIDVQFSGTTTSTNLQNNIFWEGSGIVSATNSQVWTESVYLKLVSGSMSGVTLYMQTLTTNPYYGGGNNPILSTPTGSNLNIQRNTCTFTTNSSGVTSFTNLGLTFAFSTAATYNFTLRIGLPQLELGAFPTSVITTTTAAATRLREYPRIPLGSWYNASAFSLLVEAQKNIAVDPEYGTPVELNDGTTTRRTTIYNDIFTATMRFEGGGANILAGTYTPGVPYKIAAAITGTSTTTGTIAASFNGAAAVTGTTTNLNSASYTNMTIGYIGTPGGAHQMNGWIQRIAYYPVAFSNTQLQAMSS